MSYHDIMNETPEEKPITTFIDELCEERPKQSLLMDARIYWAEMMFNIRHDSAKMVFIFAVAGVFGLSILAFLGLALLSPSGAVVRGSCPDDIRYTIQPGDTLGRIATEQGADYREMALWNEIENPDIIHVGDSICLVSTGRTYEAFRPVNVVEHPDHCAGQAHDGTVALYEILQEAYPELIPLGTYNCRDARGGSKTSTHGAGIALDLGTGTCTAEGYEVFHEIIQIPGIQRVAYCEAEFRVDLEGTGVRQASETLARWHGSVIDGKPPLASAHLHIELTPLAAETIDAVQWKLAVDLVRNPPPMPEIVETIDS